MSRETILPTKRCGHRVEVHFGAPLTPRVERAPNRQGASEITDEVLNLLHYFLAFAAYFSSRPIASAIFSSGS